MRVTELNIYPIKSCGQVPVDSVVVEPRGLAGDRRFMLVDDNGRFLTQRRHPRMALIQVAHTDRGFRLHAPGAHALELPAALPAGRERPVVVWQSELDATLAEDAINAWFSEFLEFPAQLVFMADSHERRLKPDRGRSDDRLSFADGAPLLLISEASLADLNSRLTHPVSMQRFRPNLVVTTDTAFAEDEWQLIRIGEAEFEVSWACTRCVMTTVDPASGEKDSNREPLATLSSFRRVREGVVFGQNLIPRRLGRVQVGDRVELLATR
jgi:uncharacterized protein YcbX